MKEVKKVLVTGGAGYVGAVLVPKLVSAGYEVTVIDLYIYGEVFSNLKNNSRLKEVKADIRDSAVMDRELKGVDAVIHLACISNDPSYELNPSLGKTINYDAFVTLMDLSIKQKVSRFIYASSSSVYGVKDDPNVTEELSLEPLTDYSKYKALCEEHMLTVLPNWMTGLIIRPATVCGYSPRLRLDLSVNILTNFAINKGEIQVFGGSQKRPNIHIDDISDLYVQGLKWPHELINRKIYNAGYENHSLDTLADLVRAEIGPHVKIKHVATNDNRSYHVSSEKILRELGFKPKLTISDAVRDLKNAFAEGKIVNSFENSRYFNIKRMQEVNLT